MQTVPVISKPGAVLPAVAAIAAVAASTSAASAAVAALFVAASTAAAARSTLFSRTRFIHRHWSVADFLSIQRGDGLLSCLLIRHLDKAEASRLTGELIAHDGDAFYCSELREFGLQLFFRNVEIEITYEDVSHRSFLAFLSRAGSEQPAPAEHPDMVLPAPNLG